MPVAGDAMESAIVVVIKHQKISIGERTAAKLKLRIGSAVAVDNKSNFVCVDGILGWES